MKRLAQIRPRLQHLLNRDPNRHGGGCEALIWYGQDRAQGQRIACNGGPEVTAGCGAPNPDGSCQQDYGDP